VSLTPALTPLAWAGGLNKNICFVSVNRVCSDKSTGPKTAYQQQLRHLSSIFRSHGRMDTPDPHRQLVLDLQSWLEHVLLDGTLLVLSIDNNEELRPNVGYICPLSHNPARPTRCSTHDGSLESLLLSTGLTDVLAYHHHSQQYPATYNRGKKRLDHIFVSIPLQASILRSGILPYNSIFSGDHRPCFIDIDALSAFGGDTHSGQVPSRCQLQLHDLRIVQKYIDNMLTYVWDHKVMQKLHQLHEAAHNGTWSPLHQQQYERLDTLITEGMLYSERQASKRYSSAYAWSPP
jgi:hypothetical protein